MKIKLDYGLKIIEQKIQHRNDRIHIMVEELTLLNKRRQDILDRKVKYRSIQWDYEKVKGLLGCGLSHKDIAVHLNVSESSLNSYIWRMREKGEDI